MMESENSCRRFTRWKEVHLLVSGLGLLTALGFATYGIVKDAFHTSDSCYLFIFIVNCLFAIVYLVKGINCEDPYDLAILVLSLAPPLIYIIVDYMIGHRSDLKLARMILGLIFSFYIATIGVYYFWKFARSKKFMTWYGVKINLDWTVNREIIKKNQQLEGYLRTMLLFFFLLSINLQCDFSAAVFVLTSGFAVDVGSLTIRHKVVLVFFFIELIVALAACICGHVSIKKEKKSLVITFAVLSVCLTIAGAYLLYQAIIDLHTDDTDRTLNIVATFTSVLMLFVRGITCASCYLAYKNFGKGLMQSIHGQRDSEQRHLLDDHRSNPGFTDSIQYQSV